MKGFAPLGILSISTSFMNLGNIIEKAGRLIGTSSTALKVNHLSYLWLHVNNLEFVSQQRIFRSNLSLKFASFTAHERKSTYPYFLSSHGPL